MAYYIIQNNNILIAEEKETLEKYYDNVLLLPEDYTPNKYIVVDNELMLNPHYDEEETGKREADFKGKFFNIVGYGWFRKVPKGYQSAVECLNLAFNNVSILGKLPAETLIFYTQPDFTKTEECTEEWLIEHQTKNAEMSVQEFGQLYAAFSVAWNNEEHK